VDVPARADEGARVDRREHLRQVRARLPPERLEPVGVPPAREEVPAGVYSGPAEDQRRARPVAVAHVLNHSARAWIGVRRLQVSALAVESDIYIGQSARAQPRGHELSC